MRERPFCVALTGGIGSGKSLVAEMFAGHGVAVVDTDVIAHALTAPGGTAMMAIRAEFGAEALTRDGALDRGWMAARVFADAAARRRLESILHPLIRAEAERQVRTARGAYTLLVVPLLVESGHYGALSDRILAVDSDPAMQLARVLARPGMTEARARAILGAQATPAARLAIADDILDNRGGIEALAVQVAALHDRYLALAAAGA